MVSTRIVKSEPALVLEDRVRYLVVTDLHKGYESRLVANDIHVNPKEIIAETTRELENIVNLEKPDILVLLGDVKSGTDHISVTEWSTLPLFFEIGKKIETIVVPGNHDGNIQKLAP